MGRPPSGLDDYLDWQERLENYKASGLEVDVFCLQEGVSSTTAPERLIFYAKVILEYNINRSGAVVLERPSISGLGN